MVLVNCVTDLVGNTPLLKLERLSKGLDVNLYGKCEFLNPISVKDRPVKSMVLRALEAGRIKAGDEVVEASSGNTAMALAYIGNLYGLKVKIFMSEIQSIERRRTLKALGAKLVLTPAQGGTKLARECLLKYCEENKNAFYIYQHGNFDNPRAHMETTGPEIWRDLDGKVDAFVCGLGTCGTFVGTSRFFKEKNPNIKFFCFEPAKAPVYSGKGEFKPHRLMGVGPGFVAEIYEKCPHRPDEIFLVDEEKEAFPMVRRLAREEGIIVGISSGASAHVALQVARREEMKGKNIVCMLYDTGQRYMSVEDLWEDEST